MKSDLIFDIGMHSGRDTEFYLRKGFRVVAIEAASSLVENAKLRFSDELRTGQLKIEQVAMHTESGKVVDFFLNPRKDDWGSLYKNAAEKGIDKAVNVSVQTATLMDMFDRYGAPYYLKCDIEGADQIVLKQLSLVTERPKYVSFEVNGPEDFDVLSECGYHFAQLVNQNLHWSVKAPLPAREGDYVDASFDGHCSGLFGRELPEDKWISIGQARERFVAWDKVRCYDPALVGYAWLDVHAKLDGG